MSIIKNKDGEKPLKTYYATCRNFGFNVFVQKEKPCENCKGMGFVVVDGKTDMTEQCPVCKGTKVVLDRVIKQTNNGSQMYIGNQPQFLEEFYQFTNKRSSNQHGYVSLFEIYKSTPQYLVDELENICKDKTVDTAMFQDDFEKGENPGRFEQLEKNRRLAAENKTLQEKIAKDKDKVANVNKTVKTAVEKAVSDERGKTADAIKKMQSQVDVLEAAAMKG